MSKICSPTLAPITIGIACCTRITESNCRYNHSPHSDFLQSDPTIVTTIDVDVDDDWTRTVTRTPIMSPTTGFCRSCESETNLPAALPPSKRKDELRNVSEQMNRYSRPVRATTLPIAVRVRRVVDCGGPSRPSTWTGPSGRTIMVLAAVRQSRWFKTHCEVDTTHAAI